MSNECCKCQHWRASEQFKALGIGYCEVLRIQSERYFFCAHYTMPQCPHGVTLDNGSECYRCDSAAGVPRAGE